MEEKPKNYQEYKEPFNYFSAVTLTCLGAVPGLILWFFMARSHIFSYVTFLLLGLLICIGAWYKQSKKQMISAIIATIVIFFALVVGDILETLVWTDFASLNAEYYLSAILSKSDGFRIIFYIMLLLAPSLIQAVFGQMAKDGYL